MFRGMATEDDTSASGLGFHHRQRIGMTTSPSQNGMHIRPPPGQHLRSHFSTYGADYSSYYSNTPPREQYIEYPYGYEYRGTSESPMYGSTVGMTASPTALYPVSPQTLHASSPQSTLFYDYSGTFCPPNSNLYYNTHQTMLYPAPRSPVAPSQLPNSATLSDEREMQVCLTSGVDNSGLISVREA
jgi:hypothetical protein